MKAIINPIIYFILASTILTSCKKERQYSFIVSNNTSYRIDKFNISLGQGTDLQVEPYSSSSTFSLTHTKPRFNIVTEPSMSYRIVNYSDTTKSYETRTASSVTINNLKKDGTNAINIQISSNPDSKYPTDIFEVTIN